MPRPTETMISAAVRSTARAASRNGASGFCRICSASECRSERFHGRRAAFQRIRPPRACLQRGEHRTRAAHPHIAVQLALKELAHERQRSGFHARRDHVAHQHLRKPRGQLGREIADLIGVREQHQRRAVLSGSTASSAAV